MAQDDIALSIKVEGSSTLASLKKDFKDLQVELSKTKEGSKEYLAVLQRLGKVKDEIGDLRDTISALNPEGKIAAFSNVVGKFASGFQAATGAAALFGTKSEEVEKTLLKVQAATAFAEGIRSLTGMKDAFVVLGTVIKSNPIFALASVVAAVTAAIISLTSSTKDLNAETKKQSDLLNDNIKTLERQVELLQAQGASEEKILKVKKELIALKIQEIEASKQAQVEQLNEIKNNKTWYESLIAGLGFYSKANEQQAERAKETNEKIKKSNQEVADLKNQLLIDQAKADKAASDKAKQEAEEKKKIREKEAEEEKQLFEKTYEEGISNQEKTDQAERDRKEKEKELAKAEQEALAEYLSNSQADEDAKAEQNKERRKKDITEITDKEKAAAEEQKNAKIQAANQGLAAAKGLSDLFFTQQLSRAKGNAAEELKIRKKQFEVDKAFSIARAVIDGVRSVQAALTIPPPAGLILAAANGILAAANIAKIASTKFDGGAVSGGGDISVPSTSANIPAPPIQGPITNNQPNTSFDKNGNNLNQLKVDVHISETEITQTQDRVSSIQRKASF